MKIIRLHMPSVHLAWLCSHVCHSLNIFCTDIGYNDQFEYESSIIGSPEHLVVAGKGVSTRHCFKMCACAC